MNYNIVVMETFGQWLLHHRKALGFTQGEVAKRANISVSYVSTLERSQPHTLTGEDIRPEPEVIEAIAKAVKGSVSEAKAFFGYAPENPLPPEILVVGFDGLDANDLKIIAEHMKFLKSQKKE